MSAWSSAGATSTTSHRDHLHAGQVANQREHLAGRDAPGHGSAGAGGKGGIDGIDVHRQVNGARADPLADGGGDGWRTALRDVVGACSQAAVIGRQRALLRVTPWPA